MIFDTHAHYDDERFSNDLDALIIDMSESVSGILTCSVDYESSQKSIEIAKKYDNVYAAVGVFPSETEKAGAFDEARLSALAKDESVVCIGEIGLDYYWETNPAREIQIEWASRQIELANKLALPISFHDRDAHSDTMDLLRKYKPKGVLHCFSGSAQMAKEIYDLGMHIGVGGVVTFKNARKTVEVVAALPLEAIVLETDAPYLAPEPMRGNRNRSDYIIHIAEKIAQIKNISADEVLKTTNDTARKIFLEGIK